MAPVSNAMPRIGVSDLRTPFITMVSVFLVPTIRTIRLTTSNTPDPSGARRRTHQIFPDSDGGHACDQEGSPAAARGKSRAHVSQPSTIANASKTKHGRKLCAGSATCFAVVTAIGTANRCIDLAHTRRKHTPDEHTPRKHAPRFIRQIVPSYACTAPRSR